MMRRPHSSRHTTVPEAVDDAAISPRGNLPPGTDFSLGVTIFFETTISLHGLRAGRLHLHRVLPSNAIPILTALSRQDPMTLEPARHRAGGGRRVSDFPARQPHSRQRFLSRHR